jgi:hypothetical protein
MSCSKCALRRFDGHGTPYKPTNTMASKEVAQNLSRMLAEREQQDAGIFQAFSKNVVQPTPSDKQPIQIYKQLPANNSTFYSLSDSN